jgi:hypothetical protein
VLTSAERAAASIDHRGHSISFSEPIMMLGLMRPTYGML